MEPSASGCDVAGSSRTVPETCGKRPFTLVIIRCFTEKPTCVCAGSIDHSRVVGSAVSVVVVIAAVISFLRVNPQVNCPSLHSTVMYYRFKMKAGLFLQSAQRSLDMCGVVTS